VADPYFLEVTRRGASLPFRRTKKSERTGSLFSFCLVWAELGDAAGRWESARHLQAHAGAIPVTKQSGKARSVGFRFACNKHLRAAMQQFAFLSLRQSAWARAYYDRCRARGHEHQHALRALAAKWLKIIFVMWSRRVGYDEQHHLANIARHHLRQPA
jgi:transposase